MDNSITSNTTTKIKYFIFALFLSAGYFKADPRLGWLPVDLTLITALLTSFFVMWEFIKQGFRIPKPIFIVLSLYVLFLPSMFWTEWHSYAFDKTVRFFTLTLLATITPFFLIKNEKELNFFFKALVLLSAVLAADALFMLLTQSGQFTRLTAFGSNTIALGRATGITFLWLAVSMLEKRINYFFALIALGALGIVLLSSGSRGPLLATILCFLLVFILFQRLSPTRIILLFILISVSITGVWFSYTMLPDSSLQRVEHFLNGDLGSSELQRVESYKISWQYIQRNPLGIGLGGFASEIDLWSGNSRQYPHNIFLEIFLEGGLLSGLYFLFLLLMVLSKCYSMTLRQVELQSSNLFAIFVFLLINAMVSGDLNDNKMLFALIGIILGFGRIAGEEDKSCPPNFNSPFCRYTDIL